MVPSRSPHAPIRRCIAQSGPARLPGGVTAAPSRPGPEPKGGSRAGEGGAGGRGRGCRLPVSGGQRSPTGTKNAIQTGFRAHQMR